MNASSAATRTTRRALLADARLYLCTDSRASRGDLREFLHACYEGGTDIIQLRDKKVDTRDEIAAVETLAEVATEHGKLFAVNDRADIAALTGADILHVGQEDLSTEQARQIVGPEVLIGRSNRNLDMFAASLADDGIDYAVIGPVYATPTKPDRQPVGVEMVREAAALVRRVRAQGSAESHQDSVADIVRPHDRGASDPVKPWWAIGGINAETAGEVIAAGAERIVVVRALTEAANPEEAARALRAVVSPRS
ncbi:thiamine phosphate synthase [Corynebacterium amycolatum]|uniref:Thiamine-phosphate synthase n=1 Tax=Corynebacterium amycolatum TaxID=43765 RepID=A0AB37GC71_CORAY|nr:MULTISPECIES: thiamine phosphate synthase [Corynebacterium]MBC6793543.1 thiamine phosphate synthase [Corynebacterium sp. LK26]MCQ9128123.1 thiamine phosphate synthase [Corynebacterium amycolatum]MCQ9142842.1 thiamine phosphate synthase [Corynebacterium amycolatum]QPR31071.1 thiamine phosphate synthase [Corynebacterium amycolatum]QQB82949.1 thiamine phosphate synthase [Corynebacterium amycolatum]